jgi:two-component system phosphate regulon sensor histidine kinase PhoR
VKYSLQDGVVTVRAQYRRGFVLLEVIDVGIGIDPAYQQRIFERFFRVDKGRARAAGGTGLGLSIVKKLVEKMGAAIEVRSKPSKGSIFRVLFRPAEDAPQP